MLIKLLKSFFKSNTDCFDEITPEILEMYRQKYFGKEYLKWLRNKRGEMAAAIISRKEFKGEDDVPDEWNKKAQIIEEEIIKEESREQA